MTQSNLEIKYNLYQNPNDRKNNPKTQMKAQRTPNSENNIEIEEQSWKLHTS